VVGPVVVLPVPAVVVVTKVVVTCRVVEVVASTVDDTEIAVVVVTPQLLLHLTVEVLT
jgi:hypothetical protein